MKDLTLFSDFDENEYLSDVGNQTVPEYLLPKIEEFARKDAGDWIVNSVTGERRKYVDFEFLTRRIGSAFYKRGLRKGDTLLYMTYDMFYIHVLMVGIWRANGIVRSSYPEDDEITLLERVIESRVGWILCEPETSQMCLSVASKLYWDVEVIVIGQASEGCTSIDEILNDDGSELPSSKISGDDTALILCTSGTTGKSKGAVHTHTSLLYQIMLFEHILPEWKPNLIASKGTHITGSVIPLSCIATGKTAIVMAKVTKINLFEAVHTHKPAMIFGFPTFLLLLVHDPEAINYDFSSLEVAYTGGAPMTPTTEAAILTLPNVKCLINGYGLTEGAPIISDRDISSSAVAKYPGTPPFSSGKVCPGVAVQVRHIETNEVLGPYQRGEICVKSKILFRGYLNNPEATRNTYTDDGWFKTGDVAYYDENGFFFLVDRIKEIFKYYNNHISPTELEEVILKHSDVAEACVIGIVDSDGGDRIPRAFIKLKPENEHSAATAQEIREFANSQLPNYKHLRGGLYILSEFPTGKTGKVSRQMMAEIIVNPES